jgi:hypothetical protein
MRSIIDTYFAPNRAVAELRELVKTGAGVAREELRAFALV